MADATTLECPNCHRIESVQKVTAIINSGTSASQWTGQGNFSAYGIGAQGGSLGIGAAGGSGSSSGSGTQTTLLIDRLAPPPSLKSSPQNGFVFLLSFVLFGIAVINFGLLLVTLPEILKEPYLLILTAFFLICTLFWGAIGRFILKAYNKENAEYETYIKYWQPRHQVAVARWNQLFYCHRCDGVFLPGKTFAPLEKMYDYLYIEEKT